MIAAPQFVQFAQSVLAAGTAEIGMHLHAWDSPPLVPLTTDDLALQPYLFEYPTAVMREKIHALTATLEDTLGVKMVSHRAGRWGLDERYAELLLDEGYTVDCSVTPLLSWREELGDPDGSGGPDYREFPRHPYWLDPRDVSKPGTSPLLEVPLTVVAFWPQAVRDVVSSSVHLPRPLAGLVHVARRAVGRFVPEVVWLRPNGRNAAHLRRVVRRVAGERLPYAEFALHSSELMPGGSPTFPTERSIEGLYATLEDLFAEVTRRFDGATLAEFRRRFAGQSLAFAGDSSREI